MKDMITVCVNMKIEAVPKTGKADGNILTAKTLENVVIYYSHVTI